MSGFENWPAPILRRWLLSTAAGPVIFLIGLAGRIALHDPTLLTLSTLLASCIVVRCILLFQAIRHGDYETVEGVCVTIRRAPLGFAAFSLHSWPGNTNKAGVGHMFFQSAD